MWENILKVNRGSAKQRQTNRIIYKSAKSLVDEFIQGKETFDKYDFVKYIEDNLVDRVIQDGELAKVVEKRFLKRRVLNYIKNMNTQPFHTYIIRQGYQFIRTKTGPRLGGYFISNKVSKGKLPAVKTEKYQLYVVFIKKILKKEGGAAGMKNFLEEGRKMKGFDERYLNYVIDDAIDNDNWLAEHEYGDYYLKE